MTHNIFKRCLFIELADSEARTEALKQALKQALMNEQLKNQKNLIFCEENHVCRPQRCEKVCRMNCEVVCGKEALAQYEQQQDMVEEDIEKAEAILNKGFHKFTHLVLN